MCGLAGFFNSSPQVGSFESILYAMTKRIEHRGPDGNGVWFNLDDRIGLGHQRLAVIDTSQQGHQPMQSQCGRYVVVYNGEIYNYRELKQGLIAKGHCFLGNSDTEVLLALIVEHGILQTLQLISGMFAFALWDKKNKTISLARDRIGEKPLYYGLVHGALVFGSELKSIRAYPEFKSQISRSSLALFLQYGYIPAPHSIYANIFKLPPGTCISVSTSTIHTLPTPTTYWSAQRVADDGLMSQPKISERRALQQTHALLSDIVKNRMVADVPIGAFLSGGIDSSLITALMQVHSDKPVKTFTIGFQDKAYNEAEYAKLVAQHLKTDHIELYVGATDALSVIPQLATIYDEPFADSSAIPTFLVAQLAKQHVTVCLSGDGGDEVFGGYNRYLLGQKIWKKIALCPHPIRVFMQKLFLTVPPTKWDVFFNAMRLPSMGDKIHKLASVVGVKSPELLYQHLISQWFNAHSLVKGQEQCGTEIKMVDLTQSQGVNFIEKMMITDTLSYLPDDIMVKVDRAAMAVSLESRAPYLDHQLIEFIWTLPQDLKIRRSETKWLLRQILSNYLPNKLVERPKMGFGIPLASWLRGPLRDWADSLLDKTMLDQQDMLHSGPIIDKWKEHLSGRRNWQYALWPILMFQEWFLQETLS